MKHYARAINGGLLATGFLFLGAGLGGSYLIKRYGDPVLYGSWPRILVAAGVLLAGICWISATARMWYLAHHTRHNRYRARMRRAPDAVDLK